MNSPPTHRSGAYKPKQPGSPRLRGSRRADSALQLQRSPSVLAVPPIVVTVSDHTSVPVCDIDLTKLGAPLSGLPNHTSSYLVLHNSRFVFSAYPIGPWFPLPTNVSSSLAQQRKISFGLITRQRTSSPMQEQLWFSIGSATFSLMSTTPPQEEHNVSSHAFERATAQLSDQDRLPSP